MAQDKFKVIFDITEAGYRQWGFPAVGLIFVVVGIGLIISRRLRSTVDTKLSRRLAPYLYTGFAALWTISAFAGTYSEYRRLLDGVRAGRCQVVEGTVTKFVPMPLQGHAMEHFVVNDHYFEYSDYVVTAGFNKTQSHGGPLREGLRVRICDVDGAIARLEIAE
ncbi:MAG TPA: hypothetical protein VJT09_13555 [Pyrinomonadaceae bacterium]|nr:hypothetical protein [Pyrinomonadaceae bacterium]